MAGPAPASQGRVFRLGGLWCPNSLRSKATHTPAILEATRATLSAPGLAKAGVCDLEIGAQAKNLVWGWTGWRLSSQSLALPSY
ncbi:hypothetical protein [uncultured Abiotrophia sp.]|uniref:hypothetical protein n=1 Tax=uncultured Abiotrophia sp. TaxID=316094 RepID=UPI0026126502|nr:hypothetical protein [uncultured Abiotrophia sp.]